jgi:putative ABC transport system permease protein
MWARFALLVWSGVWRNRVRTTLTCLSIVVAFLLITALQLFAATLGYALEQMRADRLFVSNRFIESAQLPIRHLPVLEATAGVRHVSHTSYFGGYLGDPKNPVAASATTPDLFLIMEELNLDPAAREAFARTRIGAVIGEGLARKHGWRVGSRITLQSRYFKTHEGTYSWPMEIVGIYASERPRENESLYFNFDYFDAARVANRGRVDTFVVAVSRGHDPESVAQIIDSTFAGSDRPTSTSSQKQVFEGALRRLGNVSLIVNGVVGAVLFTLVYLTGNVIMLSFRERRSELAVLKAMGFTDRQVLGIVTAESLTICMLSAGLGLLATVALVIVLPEEITAIFRLAPEPLIFGVIASIVLALAAAAVPSWQASRLSVAAAIARR